MLKTEYISLEREVRKQIMKAMGVTGEENNYRQRIYVVRNSTIFPTFPRRTQLLNDFDQQVIWWSHLAVFLIIYHKKLAFSL